MKKKILFPLFLCALFIFTVSICIRNAGKSPNGIEYNYPETFIIENKNNFFDYQPGFECAAFSSSYILRHYGSNDTGLELYKTFPGKLENGGGVYPLGIVSMFKSHGFDADFMMRGTIDDLKQELSKGAPVIVFIHVDVDADTVHATHYVPIVGYDKDNFYFAESLPYKVNVTDKELPYNRITDIETFKKLWKNIDGAYQNPYFVVNKKQ